jgi:1-acyl-sn-glycerol-3-phosphate acyltransferase
LEVLFDPPRDVLFLADALLFFAAELLFDAAPVLFVAPLVRAEPRAPLVVRLAMPHTVSVAASPVTPATDWALRDEFSGIRPDGPRFVSCSPIMVALPSTPHEPTRRAERERLFREAPLLWRVLMRINHLVIALTGRLVVSGDVPDHLRGKPLLLAANHIGNMDALVLLAACGRRSVAPRFLATGGLFDTRGLGWMLRTSRHVRADRGKATAAQALDRVVAALEEDHRPVLVYPEGRIGLEPGFWPERGKTGVSRMALAAKAPVIPISQWGAHEAMCYGMVRVESLRDLWILFSSWLRAILRRPVLKVHFGPPVDLSDLSADRLGDAARARDRIMRAITDGLVPLRADQLDEPKHQDPTRPVTDKRSPWRP